MILTVLVGLIVMRRGGGRLPSELRMYNSLRGACRTAGVAGVEIAAPLGLLALLRAEGRPGRRHAEQVVGLYLRARFNGEQLGDSERKEMATSLEVARKALKGSSPVRVGSP